MAKADVVSGGVSEVQDFATKAVSQYLSPVMTEFLNGFYDKCVADVPAAAPAGPSGVSADQEASDIAAAVGPLNDQIATLKQSASDAADQMQKLQAQIVADAADEQSAQDAIKQVGMLKDQLASLEALVSDVLGKFAPAAPAPVVADPAPAAPVDGSTPAQS